MRCAASVLCVVLAGLGWACDDGADGGGADGGVGPPTGVNDDGDGCSLILWPEPVGGVEHDLSVTVDGAPLDVRFVPEARYRKADLGFGVGGDIQAAACGGLTRRDPGDPRQATGRFLFEDASGAPSLQIQLLATGPGDWDMSFEPDRDDVDLYVLPMVSAIGTAAGTDFTGGTIRVSPAEIAEGARITIEFDG
jgi:hypothetical protein